ncbi:MAG: carbon storage regulator CsrA [Fibrobacter sp.]|nr:carbon storage regulator CsrA [Fibrobacter sp.]
MLVLTRKPGESIRIADNIKVIVVEIDGNNIKLGIDAPRAISIYREEVYQKILEENKQAAQQASIGISSLQQMFKK